MDYKFYRKRPADWLAKDHTLAVQHSNSLLGQLRFDIPFSACDRPRNELRRTRYTIRRALVTYTMSTYVKTEKIATTPKTLSFCCLR